PSNRNLHVQGRGNSLGRPSRATHLLTVLGLPHGPRRRQRRGLRFGQPAWFGTLPWRSHAEWMDVDFDREQLSVCTTIEQTADGLRESRQSQAKPALWPCRL